MAERLVKYPKINPIQFVRVQGDASVVKYHFRYWDEWWAEERLKPWEGRMTYAQKIQQTDYIALQFHSNNGSYADVTIDVYDQDWNVVQTIYTVTTNITGFEIESDVTGNSYPAHTHIVTQSVNLLGLPDGFYFLVANIHFDSGTVQMISEPINLRTEHENTMLIKYGNGYNDFDIFFNSIYAFYPEIRVEARLFNLTPNSDDVSYVDETLNVTQTYSKPYDTYTLGIRKVPEWMISKINRAVSCDNWKWDNRAFTKDKDAKWEVSKSVNNPYKWMTLDVREARVNFSTEISEQAPILIWSIENNGDSGGLTRFPYFVHSARLNRGFGPPVILMNEINGPDTEPLYSQNCLEVRNTTDEQALLTHAQSVTAAAYNQLGTYTLTVNGDGDAAMYYTPASNETLYTGATSVVLSRHMIVNFEDDEYGTGQYYDVKGSYVGYAFERTIPYNGYTHFSGKYGTGNPSTTHLVGGLEINLSGNVARIYHYRQNVDPSLSNTITEFIANYSTDTPNITSVKGKYPPGLEIFVVTSGEYYENAEIQFFLPCEGNIQIISFYKNGVTNTFNINAFANQHLPSLWFFDVSKNSISTANIDAMFNAIYNTGGGNEVIVATTGLAGIIAKDQTPAAPPTTASSVARTYITDTLNWTIATD